MAFPIQCTITTTLRGFNSCNGEDTLSVEYDGDDDLFNDFFKVTFYANGSCPENEGNISIIFHGIDEYSTARTPYEKATALSCTASVVDASGNKRFPQSFTLQYDNLSKEELHFLHEGFGFDKYIRRSTLLSDPSELLSDDSLTLCLEIDLLVTKNFKIDFYGKLDLHEANGNWYLSMNTEFARHLCKMSRVFKCMVESPMVEKVAGRVSFPPEEVGNFKKIYGILTENLYMSLYNICKLYIFADKYDMQEIIETCHQLLKSVIRSINTREILDNVEERIRIISELAERFENDESLSEILKIYSDIKYKVESGTHEFDASNFRNLESEWRCRHQAGGLFMFVKSKSKSFEMDAFK